MKAAGGSRTAVLVCQGRAVADGLTATGRFADPLAAQLLRGEERRTVEQVRAGRPPASLPDRIDYESVRACATIIVPRVIAIDDALRDHPSPQVVLLGAGLDDRAWRMPELAGSVVFEVDHPASQRDKRERLAGLGQPWVTGPGEITRPAGPAGPAEPVRFVPVDFARDRLGSALAAAGHRADAPTTWIWEGVVPYLTRAEVERTMAVVAGLSAPDSRLIINYQARQVRIAIGQWIARMMHTLARRRSMWVNEPWRSYWTAATMCELLGRHGFTVRRDEDLLAIAERLDTPTSRRNSLRSGRVVVADRPQ
ncbi:methyltransferase [Frankia sp. CcI49]|uniref:class I SAM-dependent methyltransferase n=1 Tax=unclassified Frankia TaxID=2632575 RepID=UPI0006CA2BF2|nr:MULTISPECIES: class I SAM-dependent methyltransferase [unclassified Frankia]KPM52306.1 methyltransferase [Frankia sp. R43]ONH60000.1 methyltransferase [Frankia sp. CcI49]